MRTIVVSAVNLRKGGTLTILRDCLEFLSGLAASGEYQVIALVHRKELVCYPNILYVEMPWTVKSWFLRLWCEYVTMHRLSCKLSPVYLWLSLHDTTPRVKAKRRAVYCHNPFPFYPWKWKELLMNYRIVCFSWFSKYIYRVNIQRNNYIIVQQQWIKNAFVRMFHLAPERIIVANPHHQQTIITKVYNGTHDGVFRFVFPSYGDIHKNFELLCQAAEQLENEIGKGRFKVLLTISGLENKYTRWLYRQWGKCSSIDFVGFMSREQLYQCYGHANCLVFPSKVETWGLPISEFAAFEKPMLLADLPYAHETAAGSRLTAFFNPQDAVELKEQMKRLINGNTSFLSPVLLPDTVYPYTENWPSLFQLLIPKE